MRSLAPITLAALVALGGVAAALETLRPAGESPQITLAMTPVKQTVARGAAVTFGADLGTSSTRVTRLRVRRLPRGVTATWRLTDGRRTKSVPVDESGVVLTLRASRRARLGTHRVTVVARADGAKLASRLRLTVVRARAVGFSLRVGPARRTLSRGQTSAYRVRIKRSAGFRRRVRLHATVRPRDALPALQRRGRRIVVTPTNSTPDSTVLVVRGTSRLRGRRASRYAVAVLRLVETEDFQIDGDLATTLRPGVDAPLDLELTNPHPFEILVTALDVAIQPETTAPECSVDENYAVTQYSGEYPLVLPPGSTDLSSLTSTADELPHVSMHSLPTSQDACQGAELTLDYTGVANQ